MIEPVARGQEARADRMAAIIAGGGAAALALVKVAVVQPLFREVLERYDPTDPDFPNLYAFFWTFWYRLPVESVSAMRLQVLTSQHGTHDPAHPPPARSSRADPGVCRPGLRQRRHSASHHLPGRPRDLRADAPQPALRPTQHRAHRLSPRRVLSAGRVGSNGSRSIRIGADDFPAVAILLKTRGSCPRC